ncbi:GNAT family N-acetyltransferase [Vagococcus sp. JNUCC 83]
MIYTRLAEKKDMSLIETIIDEAKEVLRKNGSPQWQEGKPNKEMIISDMENKFGYVLIYQGNIVGYLAMINQEDEDYKILDNWEKKDNYVVIHRVAISSDYQGKGLANYFFSNIISIAISKGYSSIRIDTHRVNLSMQHLLKKFKFVYRGIVFVESDIDGERFAYELLMED